MKQIHSAVSAFWRDEKGLGTLEVLLIVAVLVAIAVVFRKWIVAWFQDVIGKANNNLKDSSLTTCVPGPSNDCSASS